jgi:hypothetical protein
MARCKNCDYPYASRDYCPKCHDEDPRGIERENFDNGCLGIIAIAIVAFFIYNYGNSNESNGQSHEGNNKKSIKIRYCECMDRYKDNVKCAKLYRNCSSIYGQSGCRCN